MKAIKVKPILFKEGKFVYPIMNSKNIDKLNYAKNALATKEKKTDKSKDNQKGKK